MPLLLTRRGGFEEALSAQRCLYCVRRSSQFIGQPLRSYSSGYPLLTEGLPLRVCLPATAQLQGPEPWCFVHLQIAECQVAL